MGPATPLPVTPFPAHYRASDADGARDVEAAVVAPRDAADRRGQVLNRIVQAKDLGAIAQLGLMLAARLDPELAPAAQPRSTRGGRPDGTARRVEYRPPAVSSEESRSETCGGHGSDADGDIATPSVPNPGWRLAMDSILGATAPSATEKSPVFQSGVRDRKPFKTLKVNSSPLSLNQAKERRDRVEAALEPLCDTGPFVLLCTGDPGSAVVVPVAVGENADAVDQWTAIQNASLKHASRWRSWAGLARLELVTSGPTEDRTGFPAPFVIGGMVTFCGTIFVMRVIHGDWGIAYTAGAFFVALAGVLSTWVAGKPINPDG
ncbi:hypothetical protein LY78DRAFT_685091 [Colletotrichum sublineola]|nr:hypothetical protein LY78DRAFT_685091 [Colletotrichum sublineola]